MAKRQGDNEAFHDEADDLHLKSLQLASFREAMRRPQTNAAIQRPPNHFCPQQNPHTVCTPSARVIQTKYSYLLRQV